jgi:hypothetical protein
LTTFYLVEIFRNNFFLWVFKEELSKPIRQFVIQTLEKGTGEYWKVRQNTSKSADVMLLHLYPIAQRKFWSNINKLLVWYKKHLESSIGWMEDARISFTFVKIHNVNFFYFSSLFYKRVEEILGRSTRSH